MVNITTLVVLITLTFMIPLVVLLVGAGMRLFDLDGRRKTEVDALEERVAIAVRRAAGDVAVIPVVYIEASGVGGAPGVPDSVELHGRVASAEVRDVVLGAARAEIAGSRPGAVVYDRLVIVEGADLQPAA